jgi:hypothetical protein
MKSKIKTHSIKELLNTSTSQLAPATLEKLRGARSLALEHQRTRRSAPVLAWLGHHTGHHESFHISKTMGWAIAALFVVSLLSGASYWHSYTTEHEICDVDISILTGDLPIHAYVD